MSCPVCLGVAAGGQCLLGIEVTRRTRVAVETMRDWLSLYRTGGFEALYPTRLPFETPAHTDELFESNSRREAEARLQHLIELKGIGLLSGEVGSGKTTVCRHGQRRSVRLPSTGPTEVNAPPGSA